MLRRGLIAALGLVFIMTSIPSSKAEGPVDIAPTGALRVAVAVGPAASAFWTTRDPSTGEPRGVTVELRPPPTSCTFRCCSSNMISAYWSLSCFVA